MDWTHLISGLLGLVPLVVNLLLNKRKRKTEQVKKEVESTDILKESNDNCYKELTELRKQFVQQERKLMEFELLTIRYEAILKNDYLPDTRNVNGNEEAGLEK
jgi:uncharacterized protein (UPF0305 family)